MTKLNQLIAVEKDVRQKAQRTFDRAFADASKDGPLSGLSRSYQPRADDGDRLPSESTRVQLTAEKLNSELAAALGWHWDVTAGINLTNTNAFADVVVDGETVLAHAPVSFLVWFEKQLVALRGYLVRLPVLDPAEVWTYDPATAVYRSEVKATTKTRKVPRNHVLAEATKEHPAQVQIYMVDEPEGEWTTTKFSGAMPQDQLSELVARLDKLAMAVKFAREEANQTEVTDVSVGDPVFAYLFGS